jgi:hypothetical protein
MGTWIGRDAKGTQAWSHYWLGSSSYIELSYRNAKLSQQFLNGGTQNDFAAGGRFRFHNDLELLANVQYETWNMPLLAPNRKSDFLTAIQLTFWPKHWTRTMNPK